MNIENGLEDPMKEISSFNGVCLSLVERLKLETVLDQLKSDIKCDEMQFWGIIYGSEKDYYIAKALYYKGYPYFPKKKYYFCSSSNFIFSELPSVYPHHIPDFHKFNTYFIGNPDIILEKYDSEKINNLDDDMTGDNFKPKTKKKNMTETDRLSYVVRAIDRDTSVAPVGGFKMMPKIWIRKKNMYIFDRWKIRKKRIKLIWVKLYLILNFWIALLMTLLKILGAFMLILLEL